MAKFQSQGTQYGGGYNKWAALGSSMGDAMLDSFNKREERQAEERKYKAAREAAAISSGQMNVDTDGNLVPSTSATEKNKQNEYDTWHDNFEKAATSRFGSPTDVVDPKEVQARIQQIDRFVNDNMFRKFGSDGVLNANALSPELIPVYVENYNEKLDPSDPNRFVVNYLKDGNGQEFPVMNTQAVWDKYEKLASAKEENKGNKAMRFLLGNSVKPRTGYEQAAEWAGGLQKAAGGIYGGYKALETAAKGWGIINKLSKAGALAKALPDTVKAIASLSDEALKGMAKAIPGGAKGQVMSVVAPASKEVVKQAVSHGTLGSAITGAAGPAFAGQLQGYGAAFGQEGAQNLAEKMDPGSSWGRDAATRDTQALMNAGMNPWGWITDSTKRQNLKQGLFGGRNVPALGAGAMEALLTLRQTDPAKFNQLIGNVPVSEVPYEYRDQMGITRGPLGGYGGNVQQR